MTFLPNTPLLASNLNADSPQGNAEFHQGNAEFHSAVSQVFNLHLNRPSPPEQYRFLQLLASLHHKPKLCSNPKGFL